jgi:hypothetical protein
MPCRHFMGLFIFNRRRKLVCVGLPGLELGRPAWKDRKA